jgi:hypothetical protein
VESAAPWKSTMENASLSPVLSAFPEHAFSDWQRALCICVVQSRFGHAETTVDNG